jgi:hypothetical protein
VFLDRLEGARLIAMAASRDEEREARVLPGSSRPARHRYGVQVQSAERRLSVCWSKHEREQWERDRIERERKAERFDWISSTRPKADEPEPELEAEEREGELVRS